MDCTENPIYLFVSFIENKEFNVSSTCHKLDLFTIYVLGLNIESVYCPNLVSLSGNNHPKRDYSQRNILNVLVFYRRLDIKATQVIAISMQFFYFGILRR